MMMKTKDDEAIETMMNNTTQLTSQGNCVFREPERAKSKEPG